MSDRRNRAWLLIVGLLLTAGGALAACLGAGVFGTARSDRTVFDPTVVRWWDEGGWESFAVVTAIGVVATVVGLSAIWRLLHRNDGRHRTPAFTFTPASGDRGATSLRSPALSHSLEADLERIPEVNDALVGLFGRYPSIEMRAVLSVTDDVDLDALPDRFGTVLSRMRTTTGIEPDPVQVTVRFKGGDSQRQVQ